MNYLQKKKLAFMSIVNRVKGFIRTITGELPLTLEGCVDEESIIDYTIYGNSVQNGTPTPDTPVEVESVGEKTTNLINWDLILSDTTITKVENGYYSTSYFHNFDSTHAITKQIKEVLKPNVTYTLSRRCSVGYVDDLTTGNIILRGSGGTKIVDSGYGSIFRSSTFSLTQEQIDDIRYMHIYFHNKDCTIFNLQLTEGDTVLPYEPYGYKIPIKVSGKNLFDMDNAMVSVDNWYYIGGTYSYGLNLEVGKQYRFSCDVINNPGVFVAAICRKPKIADWSYSTLYRLVEQSSTTGKKSYTFVADGTECLWLYHSGGGALNLYKKYITENIKNIQLEEGTTATDYEPYHEPITTNIYLDEPLRKVGEYADYIDFENGKIVRNVEKLIVTTSNIQKGTVQNVNNVYRQYRVDKTAGVGGYRGYGYSNILPVLRQPWDGWTKEQVHFYQANNSAYFIVSNQYDTVDDFYNYISDNGANVPYLVHARETPTETPITLPNLPTFKGTSIISADTTIQPSNAEIEYYSNVKE